MSRIKLNMTSEKERPPISRWVIVLIALSVPLIGCAIIVLADDSPDQEESQSVDYWLAEAQRREGFTWKIRRLVYERLPPDWMTYLKLEHPDPPYMRQVLALERLVELNAFADASDRIVPALTDLLSQARSEAIVSLTCNTLRRLGTNAIAAVPKLLTLTSNMPPYGSANTLEALLAIAPSDPEIVRRATNILNDIIDDCTRASTTGRTQQLSFNGAGFIYVTVFAYPRMDLPFASMEQCFMKGYASQHPDLVQRMIQVLASDIRACLAGCRAVTTEQLSRLLSLWEQKASHPVKDVSIYYVIKAAVQQEETRPMANRLFAQLLEDDAVDFWSWNSIYAQISASSAPEVFRLATIQAKNWIISKAEDYPQDLGSFIEANFTRTQKDEPETKDWMLRRTTATGNPHQIADWTRSLDMYGEVELAMEQAVVMLTSGDAAKIPEMLRRLGSLDPANPFAQINLNLLARYGVGPSDRQLPKDWLKNHLEPLPRSTSIDLLERVRSAVDSVDKAFEYRSEAQERLTKLLNDFKQSAADEH